MEKEKWIDIPGFEGLYQVSSEGRVKSVDHVTNGRKIKGTLLNPFHNETHRHSVVLRKDGHAKFFILSRLVLSSFEGDPGNKICCHKDGDPNNNRLENLYWGTAKQNSMDLFSSGTAKQAIINAELVAQIKKLFKKYSDINDPHFVSFLANYLNVDYEIIWNIKHNRTWKNISCALEFDDNSIEFIKAYEGCNQNI